MNDYPTGIGFEDALQQVMALAATRRTDVRSVALGRAHGHVLATDVVSPLALPPFDNSAMDGFAFRHADLTGAPLRLVGDRFAGPAGEAAIGIGECMRITTGAPLPAGADSVAIKENCLVDSGHVRVPLDTPAGANVRRAGEDVEVGQTVLYAGALLTPARVALAAAAGVATLGVARKPSVAVFTTGDELVEPGLPLAHGQIHDSNRDLLMGLLRADGLEPTAWPALPDDPARIEIALRDAACAFDVVLTCGGVSAGEKDHVPAVLERFGRIAFWKVRMKPGMPLLVGELDQAVVLALPGNPVSVLATYLTLGRALLDGLQGRREPRPHWRARLSAPIEKKHARREFVRGLLEPRADGTLAVGPNAATGSHRLRAAAESNALIVVPDGPQSLAAGDAVDVLPY
ncbi:MAG TPA: gephyrin-like molybdotransferase Glp [Lysobacter sp.]|nr:gephyrin-like molybdotransferase Glp [Lysobacter sp.]